MDPYKAKKFFEPAKESEYVKLKDDITKNIKFSCSNIVTDIDEIDSKNPSIVMARNMWPYINPEKYSECANKLYNNLANGSIVIIGGYDWDGEEGYDRSDTIGDMLRFAGFKPVDVAQGALYKTSNKGKPYFVYLKE